MYHFFRPIYEPHNDQAREEVRELASALGLTMTGTKGQKYSVILSSYLRLVTWVMPERDKVIWPVGNDNKQKKQWAYFPMAGATTIQQVRSALIEKGYIRKLTRSDVSHMFGDVASMDELAALMGVSRSFSGPMRYTINGDLLDKDALNSCEFVEAHKPHVLVSLKEDYSDKIQRRIDRQSSPKMPLQEMVKKFGRHYSKARLPVLEMNEYWRQHPLEQLNNTNLPNDFYASATRIYHHEDLRSGGRWYGSWNDMQSWERLNLLIDGEAVAEIDLNASQVTLFSSLRSQPMKMTSEWEDAYKTVTEYLSYDEPSETVRDKVKQVVVELIGAGNPNKDKPSTDRESPFDESAASIKQFQEIRDLALKVFPALNELNKKKRLDFSGFLSFHEAAIMTETLLKLKEEGVVAYPVHDCWIVKRSDIDVAVTIIRKVINSYVTTHQRKYNLPVSNLSVALSIERKGHSKQRLSGCYWT